MTKNNSHSWVLRLALLALSLLVTPTFDTPGAQAATQRAVTLSVSQGRLLTLAGPAASVFVADPSIADVQVPLPSRVFVFGKRAGSTTLYALDSTGHQLAAMDIEVVNNISGPAATISRDANAGDIQVQGTENGLALDGEAIDPEVASDASRSVTDTLGDKQVLDDHIKVKSSAQVTIRVRIAEVSRSIDKDLGINWDAVVNPGAFSIGYFAGRQFFPNPQTTPPTFNLQPGGDSSILAGVSTSRVSINTVIDALSTEGLISILAEPNLTALSGQPASFLAGGEFPIPIEQSGVNGNSITILFKQYGVSLSFVPTVLSSNHISLHVRPEVSQLTDQGAITLGGLTIPALQVRRADTTVELGSGETFAIGGLLQNNTTSQISRYPGLGDLPVLGALFRSSNFQRNESELLIIVTPYIVKPIDDPNAVLLPTDGFKPATDLERIFLGWIATKDATSPYGQTGSAVAALKRPRLAGDAGFDLK